MREHRIAMLQEFNLPWRMHEQDCYRALSLPYLLQVKLLAAIVNHTQGEFFLVAQLAYSNNACLIIHSYKKKP